MSKKEIIIKKPSALSQTVITSATSSSTLGIEIHTRFRGGLTADQRKLINAFIHIVQKTGDQNEYKVSTSYIQDLCGISRDNNYELRQLLSALQEVKLVFNYLGKSGEVWDSNVLLPRACIEKNSDFITFEFTSFIRKQILNPVQSTYVSLDLLLMSNFSSTYTIALYEILRDYIKAPKVPELTIEEFRSLMGVKTHQYKDFPNLRLRVIDTARNEINEKSDILCHYDLTKALGNQYATIQWYVEKKHSVVPQIETSFTFLASILEVLPEKYQIRTVYNLIKPYLDRADTEAYIISNIKYALKNSTINFISFLEKALLEDFAKSTRELEQKESDLLKDQLEKNFPHLVGESEEDYQLRLNKDEADD